MSKLHEAIFQSFTEEDWDDVKDDIKEIIVQDFNDTREAEYLYNIEMIQDTVGDYLSDSIENMLKDFIKEVFEKEKIDFKALALEAMKELLSEKS